MLNIHIYVCIIYRAVILQNHHWHGIQGAGGKTHRLMH